jgi:hypothetical protein
VDEIRRDSSPQDHEEVGSSPKVVLECGRRRGGLAVVCSFSAPIRLVVVISGGALVEGWGKTASPHLGEGPRASGESWETVARRGGEEGASSVFWRWGKTVVGAIGGSFL